MVTQTCSATRLKYAEKIYAIKFAVKKKLHKI